MEGNSGSLTDSTAGKVGLMGEFRIPVKSWKVSVILTHMETMEHLLYFGHEGDGLLSEAY